MSDIRSLPAGRYRARVQIMFSELAKGELLVVNVQSLASSRVLDQVELRADLRNRAVTDQIYLSFTLDKPENVEFYGWVGAHCETTLLRLLTILDDPTGSVVRKRLRFPTSTQPAIRDLKEVNFGTTGICNASCIHCPTNKKGFAMPHGRMSCGVVREDHQGAGGGRIYRPNQSSASLPSRWKTPILLERLKLIKKLLPDCPTTIATNAALYDPQKHWEVLDYVDHLLYMSRR